MKSSKNLRYKINKRVNGCKEKPLYPNHRVASDPAYTYIGGHLGYDFYICRMRCCLWLAVIKDFGDCMSEQTIRHIETSDPATLVDWQNIGYKIFREYKGMK